MLLIGLRRLFNGAQERIVASHCGNHCERIAQCAFRFSGNQDAGKARFHRKGGQGAANGRELPGLLLIHAPGSFASLGA